MTLDIRKFIKNVVDKQFKISHLDTVKMEVFHKEAIPEKVVEEIKKGFGEDFLGDSNFVAFFKTAYPIDKKLVSRLFKAVDKALGDDANRLTEGDFKRLGDVSTPPKNDSHNTETDSEDDNSEDDDSVPMDDDIEDTSKETDDQIDAVIDGPEADEDVEGDLPMNEDDDSEGEKQDAPEPTGPKHVLFLKITSK